MVRDYIAAFKSEFEGLEPGEGYLVEAWEELFRSTVPETLFAYKSGLGQAAEFQKLVEVLGFGLTVEVVGFHVSKSTPMPVVRVILEDGWEVFMRNNLHDVCFAFVNGRDPDWGKTTPLPDAAQAALLGQFPVAPKTEYLVQMAKKRNFCYKVWTDEEMADPRILRVQRSNGTWSEVRGEAKDRWIARHQSTEWTHRDWGSTHWVASRDGETIQDLENPYKFNEDTNFFFQVYHGCAEGIDDYAPRRASNPWLPGKSAGYVTVDYEGAKKLLAAMAFCLG
jgi:hypothetical protein